MEFIYENNFSIPTILCSEIIEMFEKEKKNIGLTVGGVNLKVKDTTDFTIPHNAGTWLKIEHFLFKELNNNLKKYMKQINRSKYTAIHNNNIDAAIFGNETLAVYSFMIQKYEKKKGKYTYHNDFAKDKKNQHRVITYIWYLNTVEEGGETEFWDSYKIKPVAGKLVLFPASWCFHHRGIMPISDNKYIITGWFYI
jgi:Rps23 Pro-64 3,4-dihydroxylase Tpa1-like proline 4-hydroxylase